MQDQVIGRYVLRHKLADGGMAEIFLATQTGAERFERLVIVKRVLPSLAADPHFRNMLVDEAHIAMTLAHSNIAQVLDFGQTDEGLPFLVIELVDGWDLASVLVRAATVGRPMPLPIGAHIVAQVCRALAYAHAKTREGAPLGIVHRDISPQNVLLSDQGEVKLTDFGIAKALGRREQTERGVIKGKLDFMSPEQALGGELDARSDLFATGAVLYLLATGRRPFAASDELNGLGKVKRAEYIPADAVAPELPPRLTAIIARALQLDPAQRYGSADEMLADLEAVLKEELGAPGPSELKLYLASLAERDGALPVSQLAGGDSMRSHASAPAFPIEPTPVTAPIETQPHAPSGSGVDLALASTALVTLPGATPSPAAIATTASLPVAKPEATPSEGFERIAMLDRPPPPASVRRRRGRGWRVGFAFLFVTLLAGTGAAIGSAAARRTLLSALPPKLASPVARGLAVADGWLGRKPEARPNPEPAAKTTRERRLARTTRANGRAVAEGATPTATAPTPPSSSGLVEVRVTSRPPGAEVHAASGAALGHTPLTLRSPAGTAHDLTFAKAGFAKARRRLVVDADHPNVTVDLARAKHGRTRR